MQNYKGKKEKLPKAINSDLPPHYSSKLHLKNQKHEGSDRKKQQHAKASFIRNLTCPARKAFYMQEDRYVTNTPWKTSRVTSTMDRNSPVCRYSKPATDKQTAPMKKSLTRHSTTDKHTDAPTRRYSKPLIDKQTTPMKKSLTRHSTSAVPVAYAWSKIARSVKEPRNDLNIINESNLQHSTLSTPMFKKMESKERINKINKLDKVNTLKNNLQHSTVSTPLFKKPESRERFNKNRMPEKGNTTNNETRNVQPSFQNSADGEHTLRPKRQDNIMRAIPKYNDLFCDQPHLKYGMFGKLRKNRVASEKFACERVAFERNQNRMQAKPTLPKPSPQNVRNDGKYSIRNASRSRIASKLMFRLVDKRLKRQLTMSEMMHIDIRPEPVRRVKSPSSRHTAPFPHMPYYRNVMPYGRMSPPFRTTSPQKLTPKKTTQSLRNIVPYRNISSPFKTHSPTFRYYESNFSPFASVIRMPRSMVNKQI